MANTIALNKIQKLINKKGKNEVDQFVFGQKVGLMTTLFGCWQKYQSPVYQWENRLPKLSAMRCEKEIQS
jgi:hypothetical protein